MNKKQSVIGWLMIFSIAIAVASSIMSILDSASVAMTKFYLSLALIITIGGILIFILRSKKNNQ